MYYTPINGVSEQSLLFSSFDDDSDNILDGLLGSTFLWVFSFFSVLLSKLFTFLPIDFILKLYEKNLLALIFYARSLVVIDRSGITQVSGM